MTGSGSTTGEVRDFLSGVLASVRERVAAGSRERSLAGLRDEAARCSEPRSLRAALSMPGRRFIAEVKRASPSRGAIAPDLDPPALARAYQRGGAAALSVLTEPAHFGGSLDDLRAVRAVADVPVLRKDFLVDPWQAWESRVAGADAALLIAAALPGDALAEMASALAEAGLEALVEVHTERERDRVLELGCPILGINARDLRSLEVDLAVPERLVREIPRGVIAVAESGLKSPAQVARLEAAGFRAFLVGEALVTSGNPEETLGRWIGNVAPMERP